MKLLLVLISLCFYTASRAQVVNATYFDKTLKKRVPEKKARYAEVVTQYPDGKVVTEFKDLKKQTVISSGKHQTHEPFGIQTIETPKGMLHLDFNFDMTYGDRCHEEAVYLDIADYLEDQESVGYQAPKLLDEHYIANNLFYPEEAEQYHIQGEVQVIFTLNGDYLPENIRVKKGANFLLDKEAVRLVRNLQFSGPALINGTPRKLCMMIPVRFTRQ